MNKEEKNFTVMPFPKMRRLTVDAGWIDSRRHNIHGLLEMDVTKAREIIRQNKAKTGNAISFTSFVISCLARAVGENPGIHAYRDWRGRLVIFHDVNVNTMFRAEVDGKLTVLPYIVKAADKKTARQISDEIRAVQQQHGTPQSREEARFIRKFVALPSFVRKIFYWYIYRNPRMLHEKFGTVSMTAVGMFGKGGGWGIPFGNHTLCVTLGGIDEKPGVVESEIEIREYLSVTLTLDHDIVDGAPAASFANRFRELVESAYGLEKTISAP